MSSAPKHLIALGIVSALLVCSKADAVGRYRLPSNVFQFVGYGNGPGYHAPMVIGVFGSHAKPRVHRVAHPPAAPPVHAYGHGFHSGATVFHPEVHASPTPAFEAPGYYGWPADSGSAAAPSGAAAPMKSTLASPAEPRSPSDKPRANPEPIPLPKK